jgi:hypothetical protein
MQDISRSRRPAANRISRAFSICRASGRNSFRTTTKQDDRPEARKTPAWAAMNVAWHEDELLMSQQKRPPSLEVRCQPHFGPLMPSAVDGTSGAAGARRVIDAVVAKAPLWVVR